MENELLEFKKHLHLDIEIGSEYEQSFPEESFFEVAVTRLGEAGFLDNAEHSLYKDSQRGLRIDGYSWNDLERTLCLIVVHVSADAESLDKLNKGEIDSIAKRPIRFLEKCITPTFLSGLDPSSSGFSAGAFFNGLGDTIVKYRVIIVTDCLLSDRVKSIKSDPINDKPTSVEVWDLQRFYALDLAESDTEPVIVTQQLLNGGRPLIRGAELPGGVTSYLGVMPATVLSEIYDEFGQRLLEGNVRTFLDFRSGVNKGLRQTLVLEPENFFAYNNGITLTCDAAEIETINGLSVAKSFENLQIVNGGQTTAAIYFAPREPGGITTPEGLRTFRSIDLEKVSVQMKLTVFSENNREDADSYRSKISNYANSQNSVQASDLVSNHPIHLNIERLSRQTLMPTLNNGVTSKWFYERTRGQYSTKMRGLSTAARNRFVLEFPKSQLFTKTDMAKYENTWRMAPKQVKRGAQANLKVLGAILAGEYEVAPASFDVVFFKHLIAKAILFKSVDSSVKKSAWYKIEGGLKAEAVTYGIALVRLKLISQGKDINLDTLFRNQDLSPSLDECMVLAAQKVRDAISDPQFRGGSGNPSEFCRSENGWKRIQQIDLELSMLLGSDVVNEQEQLEQKKEEDHVSEVAVTINDFEVITNLGQHFWTSLAQFNIKFYGYGTIQVSVPERCAKMFKGGLPPSEKQMKAALKIKREAEVNGFDYSH